MDEWGADESSLWDQIAYDHVGDAGNFLEDDRTAQALFDAGWLEGGDIDSVLARDAFFDYCIDMGYFDDREDFDWEAWRDYMGY